MQPSANQHTQPQTTQQCYFALFVYIPHFPPKNTHFIVFSATSLILLSAQGLGLSQLPRPRPLYIGDPGNDMNSNAATLFTEVNAASICLPPFSPNGSLTWFRRAETQFRLKNIVKATTKADHVVAV